MNAEDLELIERRHRMTTDDFDYRYCLECAQDWPCDATNLVEEIKELHADMDLLRSLIV